MSQCLWAEASRFPWMLSRLMGAGANPYWEVPEPAWLNDRPLPPGKWRCRGDKDRPWMASLAGWLAARGTEAELISWLSMLNGNNPDPPVEGPRLWLGEDRWEESWPPLPGLCGALSFLMTMDPEGTRKRMADLLVAAGAQPLLLLEVPPHHGFTPPWIDWMQGKGVELAQEWDEESRTGPSRPLLSSQVKAVYQMAYRAFWDHLAEDEAVEARMAGLQKLLDIGCSPNARDAFDGQTPLMVAVGEGGPAASDVLIRVTSALVNAGADWRQEDANGNNALQRHMDPLQCSSEHDIFRGWMGSQDGVVDLWDTPLSQTDGTCLDRLWGGCP